MLYLATTSGPRVREAMRAGHFGFVRTPGGGSFLEGVPYCLENGRFGQGWPGDDAWWAWVDSHPREHCLFVNAPDVVGDAAATLEESSRWLPRIRAAGFPAALVAQDGLEYLDVPWDEFDVLFIGGTTEWKESQAARELVYQAKRYGKRVHMGRVNGEKRFRYAAAIGCDSVDGTFLAFGPEVKLPALLAWLRGLDQHTLELGDFT